MRSGCSVQESDSILVRCPECKKLFQPPKPLFDDEAAWISEGKLGGECPNHDWCEVIEA
jgi:hypothetical protein